MYWLLKGMWVAYFDNREIFLKEALAYGNSVHIYSHIDTCGEYYNSILSQVFKYG